MDDAWDFITTFPEYSITVLELSGKQPPFRKGYNMTRQEEE
jgi:hypothetical protein